MAIYDGPGLSPLAAPSDAFFEMRRMLASKIVVQVPEELYQRVNTLDHALQAPVAGEARRYFRPRRGMQFSGLRRWFSRSAVDHKR